MYPARFSVQQLLFVIFRKSEGRAISERWTTGVDIVGEGRFMGRGGGSFWRLHEASAVLYWADLGGADGWLYILGFEFLGE